MSKPILQAKQKNVQDNQLEKVSVISVLCRICYDTEREEELIAPCRCKGTVAFVHRTCLETWLAEANATRCELCHQVFKTERTPKYSTLQSIWKWCSNQPNIAETRGVIGDIVACTAITPMAVIITYICLFSSDYYNQKKFATVPAARWTSISLLIMIGIMLVGYYLWVFSIIKMHVKMWYDWWQRECIVKYIPPSSLSVNVDVAQVDPPTNTPRDINANSTDTENNEGSFASELEMNKETLSYTSENGSVASEVSREGGDV